MANNRLSVAQSLCEFLEQEGIPYRLASDTYHHPETPPGTLEIITPEGTLKDLPAVIARFCRGHDLHLVQFHRDQPWAALFVVAWVGEAGELRFLGARFRGMRPSLKAVLGGLWRRALRALQPEGLSVTFFGANEMLRRGVIERVLADLAPAFHGTLRLNSCAHGSAKTNGLRKWLPGPDLWILLDAPAVSDEHQRLDDLEFSEHLWNAAVVDASQGLPAAGYAAEWAILRYLEGRLEFRHPELQVEHNPLLARLLLRFCRRRTPLLAKLMRALLNCDIYCRIWSPVLLAHPYGIVIHVETVIGRRVTIMQQVTLGAKDRGVHAAPVLEDDVYVGSGAKILGAVHVGRGATIGANAVVTRDVPPYCTVVGANRIVRGTEPGCANSNSTRQRKTL